MSRLGSVEFYRRLQIDRGLPVAVSDFLEPQLNLLAHAQAIELEIGSSCGGHGKCGGDRIRILNHSEILSPFTEAEVLHLSDSERAQGWRLACQCFPNTANQVLQVEIL